MSSDTPPQEEREEQLDPPPPVKKRYVQPDRLVRAAATSLPTRPSGATEPPEGFVRYELDEEDSEEDPDFEADILDEDEDDDEAYDAADNGFLDNVRDDAQQADAELSHILRSGRDPGVNMGEYRAPSHSAFLQSHGEFQEGHSSGEAEEPQFDVDDLDSTDEETLQHSGVSTVERGISSRQAEAFAPDDEDDVHDVDDAELGEVDEIDSDDAEADAGTGAAEDYIKFLLGLGENDGNEVHVEPTIEHPQGRDGESANEPIRTQNEIQNLGVDDDDDFDYLRESARVQDDPLEYRDDLHVSRKELVQLLFNSREGNLRRHTRKSRRKHPDGRKRPRTSTVYSPQPLNVNSFNQATAGILPSLPGPLDQNAGMASIAPSGQVGYMGPVAQSVAMPQLSSFTQLTAQALNIFQGQLAVHVQILANLHAVNKKKAREEQEESDREIEGNHENVQSAAQEASQRSEILLQGLVENRKISLLYHQTMATNMSRLKGFADRMLQRNKGSCIAYQSCKSCVYNVPIMNHLEAFLQDCRTTELGHMPEGALSRLRPFFRADITKSLSSRPNQRQYSGRGLRAGWFVWTAQDDTLLAMTMGKYGSEVGEFCMDLLPHRQEDDCQTRVRYLSSRRCPDNAVKRQAMYIGAPLNQGELALVSRGLELYGNGGVADENVWREIQRNLLPNREWSHLQKLWGWRETRRKYKAKYRAKAIEKKRALREAAAGG